MSPAKCSSFRWITLALLAFVTASCSKEGRSGQEDVSADALSSLKDGEMPDEERWHDDPVMTGNEINGSAILAAVRTAKHPLFDRMVFEFRGEHLPNYLVRYIDEPVTRCGTGEMLSLDGDSWLEIRLEPSMVYDQKGEPTLARRNFNPPTSNLTQLELVCDFESALTWVAWISERDRFRILELETPTRLVVDVR